MKTKAVRMYGKDDLRLEEFELPEIKDGEILVRVMTDSVCMSSYKLLKQGKEHKRCPQNVDTNPLIIGHEFSGDIVKVGGKWGGQFKAGQKFAIQPAINYKGSPMQPGYSYEFCGGASTYCIIPQEVMEMGCLLAYEGEGYFDASLGEPMSCIIRGYKMNYHTNMTDYNHSIGVKAGGSILILGGCGPMGMGAADYALAVKARPARVVVTDINGARIDRAKKLLSPEYAKGRGVELIYVNSRGHEDPHGYLKSLTGGAGYDDVFVYSPISELAQFGDGLLAYDGCLNIFAGPSDKGFSSQINLYNCHYMSTHVLGTSGGNIEDLEDALELSARGDIHPAVMISHIGGLNAYADTVKNVPTLPGAKKMIYTQFDLPLTAIDEFEALGRKDPLFAELHACCESRSGMWNAEAEKILLGHFGIAPIEAV